MSNSAVNLIKTSFVKCQRQKLCDFSYMRKIKNKLTDITKWSHRYREETGVLPEGRELGGGEKQMRETNCNLLVTK